MNFGRTEIIEALSQVQDPDLKRDLVTLNMVQDLNIMGELVEFTLELTTPACPLKAEIEAACRKAISDKVGPQVEVKITMSSRVSSRRNDSEPILPGVKNIIAVASGKGGVGKSTVTVNLALGLAKAGAKVGIIDADIYGPSIPIMMGLDGAKPGVRKLGDKQVLIPVEKWGIKLLSIGFLVEEGQAVVWRGPMASGALRQFVTDAWWEELDYLFIDLPPGTGDIHLTLVQTVPVTGAVIVTTPQQVALADARKAIAMFNGENVNVPVLGVIENMSWFTPAELPDNKYHLFGDGGGQTIADTYNIPLLGQLPLIQGIREGGDAGEPVVLNKNKNISAPFEELSQKVAQQVAIRNEEQPATEKVSIVRT